MSQYRSFTALRDDGKRICHYSTQACSPEDLMRQVTNFYCDGWAGEVTLIAWAEEAVAERGGQLECDALCAESIAAGRLIELVDGRWVARGVPGEDKAVAPQATTEPASEWDLIGAAAKAMAEAIDPNAKMIERDGPARPKPAPAPAPIVSTSHPPIAGLTRTAAIGSHLLGGFALKG